MLPSSAIDGFMQEHPMRHIALTYTPGKTALTTEDNQLLEKYLQLHDFEYQLLKKTEALFKELYPLDEKLNDLRENLDNIRNGLNHTIQLADKLSGTSYIPDETNLEKIIEHNAATTDKLTTYHQQLHILYEELTCHQEILNNCMYESEEGSEKVWYEYGTASLAHCRNYMVNTIDIVSVDQDVEKFREVQHLYEERRNTFIDHCDRVLANYSTLNLETNLVLEVWKEFLKRCELMQVVATLQHSQISASIN